MDYINEDIIITIYNKLYISDIFNFNHTNKKMYNIFKKNKEYIINNSGRDKIEFYYKNDDSIYKKLYKLNHVNKLLFHSCKIVNITFLENIEINNLYIKSCFDLLILPKFTNLNMILIDDCRSLNNSMFDNDCLINVKVINITRCNNITDISSLAKNSKLYSLNISGCSNITSDITKFNNLRILNISGCNKLFFNNNIFDYLNKIKELTICCGFESKYKHKLKNKYIIEHGTNLSDSKKYCFSCNKQI